MRFRSLPIATSCAMMYDHPFISQNQHPLLGENVRFSPLCRNFGEKARKCMAVENSRLHFPRFRVQYKRRKNQQYAKILMQFKILTYISRNVKGEVYSFCWECMEIRRWRYEMMAWWKRFGRRAATLLLTVLMLLGTAAGEGADKTVINRINAPDVSADFAFAEDADLLEIIFPQILDCDAAFLRCGGETMLIDCATSGQAQRILNMFKQLGITHVDKIVNTHPHADHIGGFAELIKEITVDELWLCFPAEETVHCANAIKAAERAGVTVRMFGDGDTLTLGTATMQVWMLDKPEYTRLNDRSAQIMLTFGQRKMLFPLIWSRRGRTG